MVVVGGSVVAFVVGAALTSVSESSSMDGCSSATVVSVGGASSGAGASGSASASR